MSKVGKFKVSLDILSLIGFKEGMEEGEHIFHLPMTAGLAVFKVKLSLIVRIESWTS